MKQYEVWWADLPEPVGRRPVLLLSRSGSYAYLRSVLAVEITTKIRAIPQEVVLGPREGLPRRCVANFDNLRAVPVSALFEHIGRVSRTQVAEIKHALGYALGWIELTAA
ncbi:MAG: type II toxin-antitoxin system PemK/MazF family toxin [Deltaproteobacteria bacterium]|nr:type II toxin-antitoxin system PemK/MazF family toxin [Deltaproteobacteria bacterium]